MKFATATRRIAVVGAVGLGTVFGIVAPANAKPAPKTTAAQVIGTVKIDRSDPRVAYVHARYVCTGTGELWVSVKQTADRTADPRLSAEGSSQISAAWSDSHRNPVTCNGKWQNDKFRVDQLEPYFTAQGPQGQKSDVYGPLAKGDAWVQFCLFDDTTPPGEDGQPVSSMVFSHVR